jgi:hypothetical protein
MIGRLVTERRKRDIHHAVLQEQGAPVQMS